jgi:hypothetical protein
MAHKKTRKADLRVMLNLTPSIDLDRFLQNERVKPFWDEFVNDFVKRHDPAKTKNTSCLDSVSSTHTQIVQELSKSHRPDYRLGGCNKTNWDMKDHVIRFGVSVAEANMMEGGLWYSLRDSDRRLKIVSQLTVWILKYLLFKELALSNVDTPGSGWIWKRIGNDDWDHCWPKEMAVVIHLGKGVWHTCVDGPNLNFSRVDDRLRGIAEVQNNEYCEVAKLPMKRNQQGM